jgi:hypothetical protein
MALIDLASEFGVGGRGCLQMLGWHRTSGRLRLCGTARLRAVSMDGGGGRSCLHRLSRLIAEGIFCAQRKRSIKALWLLFGFFDFSDGEPEIETPKNLPALFVGKRAFNKSDATRLIPTRHGCRRRRQHRSEMRSHSRIRVSSRTPRNCQSALEILQRPRGLGKRSLPSA